MIKRNGLKMKTEPWPHQLKALEYLAARDCAALYTKPGSGKSKVLIDLIVNRGFKRILIVAPKKPCGAWPKQFRIHSDIPETNILLLTTKTIKQRAVLLKAIDRVKDGDDPVVFICNYDSVWRSPLDRIWMYKKLGLDCVICDESHRIKSPSSKCSKLLTKLGRGVDHRYLLTGTPLAENPMDVYAQYRFLDPSIFGTNYAAFCEEYQNIDPILTARVGFPMLNKKQPYRNLDRLHDKMFSCAFYAKATIKLPKTVRKIARIPMDKKIEGIYNELVDEGAVELGDGFMTVNNVLAMTTRKQQVTSGYLPLEYDDGTKELKRISTYRRNALLQWLKYIPADEPVVVFARFKKDLYSIRKVAERIGCGYSEISGAEDTQAEWDAGKTRVIGVQYGSGSEGIDLTRACWCIFYTLTHSLAKYEQARKRIHRPGQTRPCTFIHFVAVKSKGRTVDEDIMECQKEKKNYVTAVMRGDFEEPF